MEASAPHGLASPRRRILIGIGNEYRGDDGLGLMVAREFRRRAHPGLTVVEQSGEGTSLIAAWRGAESVLIVDAAACGDPPGTIYRFDVAHNRLPAGCCHCSSHTFGLAEAVEMARNLKELPPKMVVYAIEGESYGQETGLSSAVVKCVSGLIRLIEDDLSTMRMSAS